MTDDDREYYTQRVGRELDQAQKATNPAVCRAHALMADYYLDKLERESTERFERRT